jgi:hypothetical protein
LREARRIGVDERHAGLLDEVAAGEDTMAQRRLELLGGLTMLDLTAAAESLADRVLQSGRVPATADGDAAHIAHRHRSRNGYAADVELPTHRQRGHRRAASPAGESEGYTLPEIYTPEELLGE